MVLQRSCQSADVQAAWWLSTEWWNQSRSGIHKCFPQMVYIFTNTHTYINMYGYTHEHMHRHKKPLWISENPKDAHGLVFISICTEKKIFPRLVSGHWKTSVLFATSWNIFSMCCRSFPTHPGNYGNTKDWWSCHSEWWHSSAQARKQKSISSLCWKFRFCPSLWRADVNYESHDYSAIFFLVMLIDLDTVSFFTYKICCIYNK